MHLALQRTLSLAVELRGAAAVKEAVAHGLDITIVGDNDFYSQRAQVCAIRSARSSRWLILSSSMLGAGHVLVLPSQIFHHSIHLEEVSQTCTRLG